MPYWKYSGRVADRENQCNFEDCDQDDKYRVVLRRKCFHWFQQQNSFQEDDFNEEFDDFKIRYVSHDEKDQSLSMILTNVVMRNTQIQNEFTQAGQRIDDDDSILKKFGWINQESDSSMGCISLEDLSFSHAGLPSIAFQLQKQAFEQFLQGQQQEKIERFIQVQKQLERYKEELKQRQKDKQLQIQQEEEDRQEMYSFSKNISCLDQYTNRTGNYSILNPLFSIIIEEVRQNYDQDKTEHNRLVSVKKDNEEDEDDNPVVHQFYLKNENLKRQFTRNLLKLFICEGMNKKGCLNKLKHAGYKDIETVKKSIREICQEIEESNPRYQLIEMKNPIELINFDFYPQGKEGYELWIKVEKGTPNAQYLLIENNSKYRLLEFEALVGKNRKEVTLKTVKIA